MDFTKFAPSKFKGNFKEDAQRWFDTYECFANLCSWDEITFCTALPLFLDEFAQIWFFELSSDISKKKDALRLEFLKKYQDCYGQNFQRYCDFGDLKQMKTNRLQTLSTDYTPLLKIWTSTTIGKGLKCVSDVNQNLFICLERNRKR